MVKYRIWIVGLIALIILFTLTQFKQSSLTSRSDQIFNINKSEIFGIQIRNGEDSLSLSFNGDSWSILGHDSLKVKDNALNSFFDKLLNLKRTSLVSKNLSKWDKFMVGDSTGIHLNFFDYNGELLSNIIVGRSNAEWASNNVRIGDKVEVYQTNENVSWQLNTSATFWGEVPSPPAADSTDIDI